MSRVQTLLDAVRGLHAVTPQLQHFGPWPEGLQDASLEPVPCPAPEVLLSCLSHTAPRFQDVIHALISAAPDLRWRQTYGAHQVGADFLGAYGYVELFGPNGQFHCADLRGYLGFWGPNLTYDWHSHPAEEVYFSLAGAARFDAEGTPLATIGPGECRQHASNQRHRMMTLSQPYLTFALWRGDGLAQNARMDAA
ncbi:MAG: dimethylsulfonioproprionate lyase family protein [Pseudomonadota bacterium]